jgi:hypothetical protein
MIIVVMVKVMMFSLERMLNMHSLENIVDVRNSPRNMVGMTSHVRVVGSTPFVCRSYVFGCDLEVSQRSFDRVNVTMMMVKVESDASRVFVTFFRA